MQTRDIMRSLTLDGLQEADPDQLMARERHEAICKLEEGVMDNNQLFLDVSMLVHLQGENIDSIESNIQQTATNTHEGVIAIEKAEEHQRSCTIL